MAPRWAMVRIAALGSLVLGVLTGLAPGAAVETGLHAIAVLPSPEQVAVDTASGRVFVTHPGSNVSAGHVSVLDARRERVLRIVPIAAYPGPMVVDERTGRVFVVATGAASSGYAGSVSVLDATNGTVLRTLTSGTAPQSLAVDAASGRVFVASTTARGTLLQVLDASGAILTTELVTQARPVALAARAGRAVLLTADDSAHILDAAGRTLRAARVGQGAAAVAIDGTTGRAFVVNQMDNTVSVLALAGGRVLRTVAVGVTPSAVAVDEDTHRAFVANAGDSTVSVLDTRSGNISRTVAVSAVPHAPQLTPSPTAVLVDERTGRALVATNDGVAVLDAATGTLLHTVTVAMGPGSLAVDGLLQRAFVADDYGNSIRVLALSSGEPASPVTLAVTQERTRTLVQAFIDAYNRHDVAGVLALFAPTFQYGDCDETHHVLRYFNDYNPSTGLLIAAEAAPARHALAAWLRARFAAHDYFAQASVLVPGQPEVAGVTGLRVNDALRAQGRVSPLNFKIIVSDDSAHIATAALSSVLTCAPGH